MRTRNLSLLSAVVFLAATLCAAQIRDTNVLERVVRQDLQTLPNLSVFDNLTFKVYGLTVFLEGQVTSPALKSDAEGLMWRINGVEGVNNHIDVLPITPSDEATRMATLHAVYGDSGLTPYSLGSDPPIHIVVQNGHVMLVGVVRNEVERSDAYARAVSIAGVANVTNQLQTID
jgi:hyperosmotically inducible protein